MRTRIFSAESAAVGSSMSSRQGWNWRARATATIWRSPPDRAPTTRSGPMARPSSASMRVVSSRIRSRSRTGVARRAALGLAAREHVGRDVGIVAQGEVLVDHLDTRTAGVGGRRTTPARRRAGWCRSGRVDPGQDLDQGRLAALSPMRPTASEAPICMSTSRRATTLPKVRETPSSCSRCHGRGRPGDRGWAPGSGIDGPGRVAVEELVGDVHLLGHGLALEDIGASITT